MSSVEIYWLMCIVNKKKREVFPIDWRPRTMQNALSGQAWQRTGQGGWDSYIITTRIDSLTFIDIETQKKYKAVNGGYIPSVWEEFLTSGLGEKS